MPRKQLTEKDETFLHLKYGKDYESKVVEKWHEVDDTSRLTDVEQEVCLSWLQRIAGIHKDKL